MRPQDTEKGALIPNWSVVVYMKEEAGEEEEKEEDEEQVGR